MKNIRVFIAISIVLIFLSSCFQIGNINIVKKTQRKGVWLEQKDSNYIALTNYYLGQKNGIEFRIFNNGSIHRIRYKNGKLHGWSIFKDNKGYIHMKTRYKKGKIIKSGWRSPELID